MLLRRALLVLAVLWIVVIPLAAFAASRPASAEPVYVFAIAVYSVGHVVCHQLPERSFHLWNVVLPVCARCTGIYFGAAVTAVLLRASHVDANAKRFGGRFEPRWILVAALAPTAATLVFEWMTGVTPANWVRALAGLPIGAAVAWAIGMVN